MRYQVFAFTPDMTGTLLGNYSNEYEAIQAMEAEHAKLTASEGYKPLHYQRLLVFDQDEQDLVKVKSFDVTFYNVVEAEDAFDAHLDNEYPPVDVAGIEVKISAVLKSGAYDHYKQLMADWLNENRIVVTN